MIEKVSERYTIISLVYFDTKSRFLFEVNLRAAIRYLNKDLFIINIQPCTSFDLVNILQSKFVILIFKLLSIWCISTIDIN